MTALRPVTWGVELGVYEKALRWAGSWDDLFRQAADAGFAFVDLSVDETDDRVSRLWWPDAVRGEVREASLRHGVAIGGLCLSAHRKVAPGSADPAVRRRSQELLLRSVDLSVDLGAPLIQVAGYYAFYEAPRSGAREHYLDVIAAGAAYAAQRGVMLGIENVDGTDITSISRALEACDEIGSAHLQLYPDIGNLTERGLDVVAELAAGRGRMLALHVKDTRPGEPRRVPMGTGAVPWAKAFTELARQGWSGRMLIEMWNDSRPDSAAEAQRAREFIRGRLEAAGIPVATRTPGPVAERHAQ
ncbi:L-ribulose-5-phosphate 3-epimerase [Actinotalea sp. M2MS4P-6]|uniref:L-ribulose-5-phosphate 3-epimerase n=1 Tax=Actinotalea sp. M2MS4P-6 TaxID=2983762 RepID=UPI0021E483F8|nr:L-ribulose-5-phosphate 3-epimerase [Actinotalea sp. M2MS4P-6]MCV2395139.1 L-ribulose-5-phosphate 3-epimerase [Actinotalea sp. M2MS4P-6]